MNKVMTSKPEECPCTPIAVFMEETKGRFDLIDERILNHSNSIKTSAEQMRVAAEQMGKGVIAIVEIQSAITAGKVRFMKFEGWIKKLALISGLALLLHGERAWAFIVKLIP